MNIKTRIRQALLQEDLNFLLTNRIPRLALTRAMGRWSKIRHPWVVKLSLALWRQLTDLDLSDAKTQHFDSVHACFTRELKPGARPIDRTPEVMCSPCDAIVGATGTVRAGLVYQAKGFPYSLAELLGNARQADQWLATLEGGQYITLRLTSSMYHRFHAPHDGHLSHVTYMSGDTWNVNPIALKRVERLFCKNERAVLHMTLSDGTPMLLVPVAAVLVASMRFHALDVLLNLRYRGANEIPCDSSYRKGEEMGWFEHGSTILMFVPRGFELDKRIETGTRIQMGQALLRKGPAGSPSVLTN